MGKKKLNGQSVTSLVAHLERLLECKLWTDKVEELLTAASALEPLVREHWNVAIANFDEGRYNYDGGKSPRTPPINLQGPYFMLVAYALENLFKVVMIQQDKKEHGDHISVKRQERLLNRIKGHDLVALAEAAQLTINVSEEDLLVRLSQNSIWAGRYPVPVDWDKLKNVKVYSDGKSYLTACFYPHDVDRLNALVRRVKTRVTKVLSSPEFPMSQ